MCVDTFCVLVLMQHLSFHCKSTSAGEKYRREYRDTGTPWYRDTKKYHQVRDTGIVQNLYRDTTIVSPNTSKNRRDAFQGLTSFLSILSSFGLLVAYMSAFVV